MKKLAFKIAKVLYYSTLPSALGLIAFALVIHLGAHIAQHYQLTAPNAYSLGAFAVLTAGPVGTFVTRRAAAWIDRRRAGRRVERRAAA